MTTTRKTHKKQDAPKYLLPDFSNYEEWTGEEYHNKLRDARRFYYDNYKESDLLNYVWTWMRQNEYTESQIKLLKYNWISPSVSINCKLLIDGVPDFNPKHAEYWDMLKGTTGELLPLSKSIKNLVDDAIMNAKPVPETTENNVSRPSAQDRILEQAQYVSTFIDEWLVSSFDKDWDIDSLNFQSLFVNNKVTPTHASKIFSFYESEFEQIEKLVNCTAAQLKKMSLDEQNEIEQLREGYDTYSKPQLKKYYSALLRIKEETQAFSNTQKAARKTRKVKPKQIEDAVSKLKFLRNDTKNNLTSIKPEHIIGAETLWIYNTKTRKLGCFYAQTLDPKGLKRPGTGLDVKGSAITGFDPERSIQKTLRKPADVLRKFNATKTAKLEGFLDEVTTIESRMNGRINEFVVLLRVS